jgi:hypothetical protein
MATIVKTLLKSAMPKDKDKDKGDKAKKKKDKDKGKSQARSAHVSGESPLCLGSTRGP